MLTTGLGQCADWRRLLCTWGKAGAQPMAGILLFPATRLSVQNLKFSTSNTEIIALHRLTPISAFPHSVLSSTGTPRVVRAEIWSSSLASSCPHPLYPMGLQVTVLICKYFSALLDLCCLRSGISFPEAPAFVLLPIVPALFWTEGLSRRLFLSCKSALALPQPKKFFSLLPMPLLILIWPLVGLTQACPPILTSPCLPPNQPPTSLLHTNHTKLLVTFSPCHALQGSVLCSPPWNVMLCLWPPRNSSTDLKHHHHYVWY